MVIGVFPDADLIARDRTHVILHGAIAAAKTLLITDALVHGLDGKAGCRREGGILLEHSPDRRDVRAELGISAASWPIRLRVRMGEHLADGLRADAGLTCDLLL